MKNSLLEKLKSSLVCKECFYQFNDIYNSLELAQYRYLEIIRSQRREIEQLKENLKNQEKYVLESFGLKRIEEEPLFDCDECSNGCYRNKE